MLQNITAFGCCEPLQRGVWALCGTPARPERLSLLVAGDTHRLFELRVQAAAELLRALEEPADLVA